MYTEYTVLEKTLGELNDKPVQHYFKYHHFKSACYSFISLLDIDLSSGFQCKSCGTSPSTVIMDATSISFRKALASWSLPLSQHRTTPKAGR